MANQKGSNKLIPILLIGGVLVLVAIIVLIFVVGYSSIEPSTDDFSQPSSNSAPSTSEPSTEEDSITGFFSHFLTGHSTYGSGDVIYYNEGYVGIGTSKPLELLHVNGTIKTNELCLGSSCKISWPSEGNIEGIYVDEDGNVGIETTSPNAKFEVRDKHRKQLLLLDTPSPTSQHYNILGGENDALFAGNAYYDGTNWNRFDISKSSSLLVTGGTAADGEIRIFMEQAGANPISWQRVFTILNNGKIGIGTDSPSQLLTIYNSAPYVSWIESDQTPDKEWIAGLLNGNFRILEDGANTRFVIKAGGNVGIGTTSPNSRLSVVGLQDYANNAAAKAAGLADGDFYRQGDFVAVVH